ncbi:MAG TPA: PD-(D/E)XK nuclease family transposase [Pirellulaceae bacterium]|nr:PD-(D/E)XK nuclease family transposase [Pirellulaceae bacterium]
MALRIDPRVDFAFKLMLGSRDHPRITIHFLNSVLQPPQPITAVEILNPIQERDRADAKLAILDVLARDAEDRRYNIEMQVFEEAAGVLEMISQSPEDRQFYEARMKFLHDEEARLIAAREEGREEGRVEGRVEGREEGREEGMARGTLIGKIQTLEEIVGDSVTSTNDLQRHDSDQLVSLLAELQSRLRGRGD